MLDETAGTPEKLANLAENIVAYERLLKRDDRSARLPSVAAVRSRTNPLRHRRAGVTLRTEIGASQHYGLFINAAHRRQPQQDPPP